LSLESERKPTLIIDSSHSGFKSILERRSQVDSAHPPTNQNRGQIPFNLKNIGIMPKLKVSQPDDRYEQEANKVAEWVIGTLSENHNVTSVTDVEDDGVSGLPSFSFDRDYERKDTINVNSKFALSGTHSMLQIEATKGNFNGVQNNKKSSHLDPSTKRLMESRFHYDFTNVRIHVDDNAAMYAHSINARAYTVGHDIAFAPGEYNHTTKEGLKLLAHELAHVVQQNTTVSARGIQRDVGWARRGPLPDPYGDLLLLNSFAKKFLEAATLIYNNPKAMELVKEAQDAGVEFGGYSEEGPGKRPWPYTVGNKVYVPKARVDKVLAMKGFLFELNNAIRAPKFAEIHKEAAKGAKSTLTAKEYAYKKVELEVEGMLRVGEMWIEIKKTGPGKEWDKYDTGFWLSEYKAFKDGKKKKEDIIKDVLKRKRNHEPHPEWTVEEYYMDQYKQMSGGK